VAANSATNKHDFLVALEQAEKEKAADAREAAATTVEEATAEGVRFAKLSSGLR
jgi:hypothetical protein